MNTLLIKRICQREILRTVLLHAGLGITEESGLVHVQLVHNLRTGAQAQKQKQQ